MDLDKEAQRECLSPAWEEVWEGFLEEGTLKMHLEDKKVYSRMVKKGRWQSLLSRYVKRA